MTSTVLEYIKTSAASDPDWIWTIGQWGQEPLNIIATIAAREAMPVLERRGDDEIFRDAIGRLTSALDEIHASRGAEDKNALRSLATDIATLSAQLEFDVYESTGSAETTAERERAVSAAFSVARAAMVAGFSPDQVLDDSDPDEVAARRKAGAAFWAHEAVDFSRRATGSSMIDARRRILAEMESRLTHR